MGMVLISGARALRGGGSSGGPSGPGFPEGVEYTGNYYRRLQIYNDVIYAEWELFGSGTLTIENPLLFDLYLVGGGGKGSGGGILTPPEESEYSTATHVGGGGGGGNPMALPGRTLQGTYSIAIGGGQGNTTMSGPGVESFAQRGDDGTITHDDGAINYLTPHRGSTYQGKYQLYGDPSLIVGDAGAGVVTNGSSGLESLDRFGYEAGGGYGSGYGAGGNGGRPSLGQYPAITPGGGTQGVVLLRTLATTSSGGSGSWPVSVCEGTLETCIYLNSPDGVNAWLDKLNG